MAIKRLQSLHHETPNTIYLGAVTHQFKIMLWRLTRSYCCCELGTILKESGNEHDLIVTYRLGNSYLGVHTRRRDINND